MAFTTEVLIDYVLTCFNWLPAFVALWGQKGRVNISLINKTSSHKIIFCREEYRMQPGKRWQQTWQPINKPESIHFFIFCSCKIYIHENYLLKGFLHEGPLRSPASTYSFRLTWAFTLRPKWTSSTCPKLLCCCFHCYSFGDRSVMLQEVQVATISPN